MLRREEERNPHISPTGRMALGSSAIVKVLGQNCCRGRFVLGCQKLPRKVPPRLCQVPPRHQSSIPSLVASLVVWGRSVFGYQEVPPRFWGTFWEVPRCLWVWRRSVVGLPRVSAEASARFRQGSAKDHQGSTPSFFWGRSILGCEKVPWKVPKFHGVSGSMVQIRWAAKRFRGRFPTFHVWGRFPLFCLLQKRYLWRVPPIVLYICLPVLFWGQSCMSCWVSPIHLWCAENDPSCRCCCGILWGCLPEEVEISLSVLPWTTNALAPTTMRKLSFQARQKSQITASVLAPREKRMVDRTQEISLSLTENPSLNGRRTVRPRSYSIAEMLQMKRSKAT